MSPVVEWEGVSFFEWMVAFFMKRYDTFFLRWSSCCKASHSKYAVLQLKDYGEVDVA
jgi:hypothetical protein